MYVGVDEGVMSGRVLTKDPCSELHRASAVSTTRSIIPGQNGGATRALPAKFTTI